MKHLRLSPSDSKTFCRVAVTAHPEFAGSGTLDGGQTVEDPIQADCVPCLGEAVAFHEMHAKYAEDRLRALAQQGRRASLIACPDACLRGCVFNPCRKPYAP